MDNELAKAYASLLSRDPATGMRLLELQVAKKRASELARKLEALGFDVSRPSGAFLKAMLEVGYTPREAVESYSALENVAIEWYRTREMVDRWKQQVALQEAELKERIRHNKAIENLQAMDVQSRIWERQQNIRLKELALAQDMALQKARLSALSGGPTPTALDLKGLKTNTQTLNYLTQTYFDVPLKMLTDEAQKWQSVLSKPPEDVDPDTLKQARIKYEALSSARDLLLWTRQKTMECVQKSGQPSALVFEECRRKANEFLLKDLQDKNSTTYAMYFLGKVSDLGLNDGTDQKLYAQELVRVVSSYDRNLAGALALAIQNSAQGRLTPKAVPKPDTDEQDRKIGFFDVLKEWWKGPDFISQSELAVRKALFKPVKGAMKVDLPEGIYQIERTQKGFIVYNHLGEPIGATKTMREAFRLGEAYLQSRDEEDFKKRLSVVGGLLAIGAGALALKRGRNPVKAYKQTKELVSSVVAKSRRPEELKILSAGRETEQQIMKSRKMLGVGEDTRAKIVRARRMLKAGGNTRTKLVRAKIRVEGLSDVANRNKVMEIGNNIIWVDETGKWYKASPNGQVKVFENPDELLATVKGQVSFGKRIAFYKNTALYWLPRGRVLIVKGGKFKIFHNIQEAGKWLRKNAE